MDPSHYKAYKNRGKAYVQLGDLDSALEDFNKAIEIRPDYDQPYYDRALVYRELGNAGAAVKDLERFLEISEDDDLMEQAERKLEELQGR